jgi:predicted deacetylase
VATVNDRSVALSVSSRPAALLVSLHDVSPLTLPDCETAITLLREIGLSPAALTVLAIPHHEEKIALDAHPPTIRFLRQLEDQGARLVMHGLTHRMTGRAWTPLGMFRAYVFARGQGELYVADAQETARRLDEGRAILVRAGLESATHAFVPPAWLLSPAGRQVVAERGFDFYELFGGILHQGARHARRVVGWGSLNAVETVATAIYADLQSIRAGLDTRVAIHPADMRRPTQRRAIRRALTRLLPRMRALNYATFVSEKANDLAQRST